MLSYETPMDIDEETSDSGIGMDKPTPGGDDSMNQSAADVSFEFVSAFATATGNTPVCRGLSSSTRHQSDFSAGDNFIAHLLDDSTASTSSSFKLPPLLPRNFDQLLDGSLAEDSHVSSSSSSGVKTATASRRALRDPKATSGRRFDRSTCGRQLRFELDCSPVPARQSTPTPAGVGHVGQLQPTSDDRMSRDDELELESDVCQYYQQQQQQQRQHQLKDADVLEEEEDETCGTRDVMTADCFGSADDDDDVTTKLTGSDDQLQSLIGDMSAAHALPVVANSKHPDLMTITPDTLVALMTDAYADTIERVYIVDCRYPYEFEGGHIESALNMCSKEAINDAFLESEVYRQQSAESDMHRRTIFIFHCEFSSERAPSLLRFLRNQDRAAHADCYPRLHYPELYLLAGGYKAFFEAHASSCNPSAYRPMLHTDHVDDLRHFRIKSKTWAAGSKKQQQSRRQGSSSSSSGSATTMTRRKSLWM